MSNDKIVQLSPDTIKYSSIEQAIDAIRNGKFIIVADDEGRENEGDLICAADKITPEMVNFMLKEARGMICVAMTGERATELNLTQMVDDNTDPNRTAFTVSVDAGPEFGVTTGISSSDRAITIQRLATPNATAQDFRRPGHMFPVQAKKGGVFRRVGHTEAAIDFTRLAGLSPMGAICEILNDDGSMARRDDLIAFANKHDIPFVTIAQLIQYRMQHERTVSRVIAKEVETKFGQFTAIAYKDTLDACEHLALIKGPLEKLSQTEPYVRIQHENIIADVLGSAPDEMPHEMAQAMAFLQHQESGVVVYLRHRDDSVHGLVGSLKAYQKPVSPQKVYEQSKYDLREYGGGAQILADLGVGNFRILSRSRRKVVALRGYGLKIVETVPLSSESFEFSEPPKVALPSSTTLMAIAQRAIEAEQKAAAVTASPSEPVVEVAAPFVAPEVTPAPAPVVETVAEVAVEQQPAPSSVVSMPAPKAEPQQQEAVQELRAEPRFATMKMGGQIMSGQALFEG